MRKKILIVVAVLLSAISLWFFSTHGPKTKESDDMSSADQPSGKERGGMNVRTEKPVDWRDALTEHQLFNATRSQHPSALEDTSEQVRRDNRDLAIFHYFYRKALLTEDERKNYRELLSDREFIERAGLSLLYADERDDRNYDKVRRMMNVDVLRQAAAWDDNPSRDFVLSTIEASIIEDCFHPDLEKDLLASLSTNKLELLSSLLDVAPHRTSRLIQDAQGSDMASLLSHLYSLALQKKESEFAASPMSGDRED